VRERLPGGGEKGWNRSVEGSNFFRMKNVKNSKEKLERMFTERAGEI
jgi:hypothetical protein